MAPLQDVLSDHRSRAEKDSSRRPYAAFGGAVVPERNLLTRELLSGFAAQFWGQSLSSAASLDGLMTAAPGQPSPLPLAAPSGLSRNQFLVAAQAVSLPCFPAYCADHGGVVVDRVLVKGGGEHWWATLTGRAKVKNLLGAYQDNELIHQLKNPANYVMSASSKVSLGSTTLRVKADLDGQSRDIGSKGSSASGAADTNAGASDDAAGPTTTAPTPASAQAPPLAAATVQLRHKLRGAEARVDVAINRRMLLPGGMGTPAALHYSSVPVDVALDVGTPASSASALQYRLGLHHLTTQGTADAATDSQDPSNSGKGLGHTMHLQSAAAFQGTKTLWKHLPRSRPLAASPAGAAANGQPKAAVTLVDQPSAGLTMGGTLSGNKPPTKTIGPHNPLRKSLGKVLSSLTGGGSGAGGADGEDKGERGAKKGPRLKASSAGGAGSEGVPLIDPDQVQEILLDSTQSISRLREDVQGITSWINSGNLARSLQRSGPLAPFGIKVKTKQRDGVSSDGKGASAAGGQPSQQRAGVRNAALLPPHFKVGGMVGLAVRVPLLQHRSGTSRSAHKQHKQQQQKQQQQQQQQEDQSADRAPRSEDGSAAGADARSLQRLVTRSRDWLQQQLQGETPHHRGVLRPFASGGMVLQLGSMQRSFLDFTRIMAKADLGLSTGRDSLGPASWAGAADSQHQGSNGGQQALSIQDSGVWHTLTLSASQQLIGPVRLCADLRFALQPGRAAVSSEPEAEDGKSVMSRSLKGLPARVRNVRANFVDSVVALDVGLPKTSGLARLVAWYAPARREGMVEVRVF